MDQHHGSCCFLSLHWSSLDYTGQWITEITKGGETCIMKNIKPDTRTCKATDTIGCEAQ